MIYEPRWASGKSFTFKGSARDAARTPAYHELTTEISCLQSGDPDWSGAESGAMAAPRSRGGDASMGRNAGNALLFTRGHGGAPLHAEIQLWSPS